MNPAAELLVGIGGAVAIVDWLAVVGDHRVADVVAKPATLVLLIAAALALHPYHAGVRAWFVVGLVASLAGDVLLLGPAGPEGHQQSPAGPEGHQQGPAGPEGHQQSPPRWFVAGLGAFGVGHLAYIVGFALEDRSAALAGLGAVIVAIALAAVGRPIVRAVRAGDHPSLAGPVVGYIVAISAMVVAAWGSGAALAAGGASLFFASDAILAWDRFVRPLARGRLAVRVTYHAAQVGLVVALGTRVS